MKWFTWIRRPVVLSILLLAWTAAGDPVAGQSARARRIAVFGSSVANGTGDELRKEGYTGRLRELLAPQGWEVLNQSRGGDNTRTLATRFAPEGTPDPRTRYLLPVDPAYVVFGLSLGNEGIMNARTADEKQAVFRQFETGMRGFIDRSRKHGIVPLVTLCYTRNDFTPVEYEHTKRMNLLISTWDVPSVNFLGAVDNGEGKWADGFWNDIRHPNASGHVELLTTFVPSLFDALAGGKAHPTRATATGFTRVTAGSTPLTFTPDAVVHPFALAITARAQGDGTIAAIEGKTLTPSTEGRNIQLTPGGATTATIAVQNGNWTYRSSTGTQIASVVKADASWHQIVLSHYTARGETLLFIDGKLAGRTPERLEITRVVIGGPGASNGARAPGRADYRELLFYRSALNSDEVAALKEGTLLQASLEVYAPLADAKLSRGAALENRAQSLSAVQVGDGTLTHMPR